MTNSYIRRMRINKIDDSKKGEHPFNLPVFKKIQELDFNQPITFIIGENGMGKSTIIEALAIAYGFNPEGGTKNFSFSSVETHSKLFEDIRLEKGIKLPKDGFFLRAESFYNVASEIDKLDEFGGEPHIIDSYGGKSLHEQSHGEAFFSAIIHRFSGNGIYILDEPEAALSPLRQFAMLRRINELISQKSQFIIATHSPILMAFPNATIYSLSENGIKKVKYKETEHYFLTKRFLNNTDEMIEELFKK